MGRTALGPAYHAPTVTSTPPLGLLDGGVAETRKAPSFEGVSFIFDAGQKRAPTVQK